MRLECVLELDHQQTCVNGSIELLNDRIRAGADIRIRTDFLHNEHIDPTSDDNQLVVETSTFPQTVLIDDRWSAYFMTLRQPVSLIEGFGYPNSLSLFCYNQNGQQAMARMVLDDTAEQTDIWDPDADFPKMKTLSLNDTGTGGISRNFIYAFDRFRFFALNAFAERFSNAADGSPLSGALADIQEAYRSGHPIKLGIRGLSRVLWGDNGHDDETFIHASSSYDYTGTPLMVANSAPFVSVPADIPLTYRPQGFRYCWLVARSDGYVAIRSFNPFDRSWTTQNAQLPIRWFVGS